MVKYKTFWKGENMSIEAIGWAFKQDIAQSSAKFVLVAKVFLYRAKNHGACPVAVAPPLSS